jgi:hypothetical protein
MGIKIVKVTCGAEHSLGMSSNDKAPIRGQNRHMEEHESNMKRMHLYDVEDVQ